MIWFGLIITGVYIGAIVILRWGDFSQLQSIDLNNLGDFLAGVFGPLTIFWLILSFVLQKRELSQNTQALELQAEELRKSVEQHTQLVETTKEQLQVERMMLEQELVRREIELKPKFVVQNSSWTMKGGGDTRINYLFQFKNAGAHANELSISTDSEIPSFNNFYKPYVGPNDILDIKWSAEPASEAPDEIVVTLDFMDLSGKSDRQVFSFFKTTDLQYLLNQN